MNPKFAEVTLNSFIFVMNIFCTNPARKFGLINNTHGLISIYYTMILIGNYGTYLCTYYEHFEYLFLNISVLCRCHIIDLKISEKPYKICEVENVIKFLNGTTEMEHVTFAKNL